MRVRFPYSALNCRGRAEVARQAHNLKVVGSNPPPATKSKYMGEDMIKNGEIMIAAEA